MEDLETLQRFEARVEPADDVATLVALERLRGAIGAEVANRRRTRRRQHGAAYALGAAAAAALAVALVLPSGSSGPARSNEQHGAVLQLASYHFALPRGFVPRASTCATSPLPPAAQGGNGAVHEVGANPVTVFQAMRAAASSAASVDGGCVELALAAGRDIVPAGTPQVVVGTYQGYLVTAPNGDLTLFVAIPAAYGTHYLVLASEGLTQQQLVAIAVSGLPTGGGNQTVFEPRP